jgi:hypothetical protein
MEVTITTTYQGKRYEVIADVELRLYEDYIGDLSAGVHYTMTEIHGEVESHELIFITYLDGEYLEEVDDPILAAEIYDDCYYDLTQKALNSL